MLNLAPTKPIAAASNARRTALLTGALGAFVVVLAAILPQAASAGVAWPDSAGSSTAETVNTLYFVVLGVGAVAVLALLVSIARATRSAIDADSVAADSVESGKKAVVAGAVLFVAFAIVGVLAFSNTSSAKPSLSGVGNDFQASPLTDEKLSDPTGLKPPSGPSMSVRVNGQQFLWRYEYPDVEGNWNTYNYHDLVIPAGVTVLLDVTSSDVEHSWWVPQLGGSIDATPGYINRGWIRVDEPGTYTGHSTKVSGTNYASMSTTVRVLSPEDFTAWLKTKQTAITEAMDELGAEVQSGEEAGLVEGESALKEGN